MNDRFLLILIAHRDRTHNSGNNKQARHRHSQHLPFPFDSSSCTRLCDTRCRMWAACRYYIVHISSWSLRIFISFSLSQKTKEEKEKREGER